MTDLLNEEELAALRQQLTDRLDLAIAEGAPFSMLDKLGAASGLLRALADVPAHALVPKIVDHARKALAAFDAWERKPRHHRRPAA